MILKRQIEVWKKKTGGGKASTPREAEKLTKLSHERNLSQESKELFLKPILLLEEGNQLAHDPTKNALEYIHSHEEAKDERINEVSQEHLQEPFEEMIHEHLQEATEEEHSIEVYEKKRNDILCFMWR